MKTALKALLRDLLSTIVFVGLFALTGNGALTTGVAVGAGVVQIAVAKWRGRPVDAMQWLSLALVAALGGASLATHDSRFIMLKPTIVHFAIGSVMLKRGWLDRYMPEVIHRTLAPGVIIASGYAWAALMFGLGIANLIVALTCGIHAWSLYVSIVTPATQAVAIGAQYIVIRTLVVRTRRRAAFAQM